MEGQIASEVVMKYGEVVAAIDRIGGIDGLHTEIESEDKESQIGS